MKLLALDTATDFCSAALWLDGQLSTREALAPRNHGALLLPMVEELLGAAALALGQLDAIAFGRGPGAFTGLRLAASMTQGLAFAAGLPVIAVSDLRALAAQALTRLATSRRALICQDARMEEVYWGCFERTAGGSIRACGGEAVAPPAAVTLPGEWDAGRDDSDSQQAVAPNAAPGTAQSAASSIAIVAAGSGFAAYPLLRTRFAGSVSEVLADLYPRAREIAQLAAEDGLACAVAPEAALPVYLRDRVTAP